MVAGGVAVTAAAAAITTPLDVIKTQLMAAKRPGGTWRSVGELTVDVARKKAGVRILFKGVGLRTAAAALALLVFLGVFGVVHRTVGGALGGGATGAAGPGGVYTRAQEEAAEAAATPTVRATVEPPRTVGRGTMVTGWRIYER